MNLDLKPLEYPASNGLTEDWTWWKHGVIYHIYVRSFYDSNGDGIGDLQGVRAKLPYLKSLGIDAIWLSPVYQSANADFGYDVSHYRKIDPEYGTIEDFVELLNDAHDLDIRIIMDLILNHTSDQHKWFKSSRSSKEDPKRDWYIWRDGRPGGKPPNNWKSAFGRSAWTYDQNTNQYYLHSFLPEQPDLNWRNKAVKKRLFREIRYWLDLGVDGFRLDVINMIGKDKKFRDNPGLMGYQIWNKKYYSRNRNRSVKVTMQLRRLMDGYVDKSRVAIGEVYTMPPGDPELAANYLGEGEDSLNMAFDFSLIFAPWNARKYYKSLANWYDKLPENGWPCNVLSNHDLMRSFNRVRWRSNKLAKARIEALLLLTTKGTPFIYYGEEIGQTNARIKRTQLKDPLGKKYWPLFKGRDQARTPMQWTGERHGGFTLSTPWLPVNNDYQEVNVDLQQKDKDSMLRLYKSLIEIRKDSKALQSGTWKPIIKGEEGILGYLREFENESLIVYLNFTPYRKQLILPGLEHFKVLFSLNNSLLTGGKIRQKHELMGFDGLILKAER